MRILNISAQKPHSTGSGVYLTATVRELRVMGHEVAVVAGVYADDEVRFPEGVSFFPVYFRSDALPFAICGMSDEMPYESTRYREMTEEMVSRFEAAFASALTGAVESFHPDLIICHHLYLLTALTRELLPTIPVRGLCHGTDLRQLMTNPLRAEEIRRSIAKLEMALCLHEKQREQVMGFFDIPKEKTAVVGVGYDDGIFHDRRLRVSDGKTRLIFAGKVSEKKGVYSLIRALDLLGWRREEFSLTIAGGFPNDEQRERAERAAADCGWDVRLAGPLSQEELASELSRADVFILPSFFEGLPLVLCEALSCGAKAVCTDLPGVRQWLEAAAPGNGVRFVAPPRLHDADVPESGDLPAFEERLAGAIRAAAADKSPAPDLSAFTWAAVAQRMLQSSTTPKGGR